LKDPSRPKTLTPTHETKSVPVPFPWTNLLSPLSDEPSLFPDGKYCPYGPQGHLFKAPLLPFPALTVHFITIFGRCLAFPSAS